MAYLIRQAESVFWTAQWTGRDGKKKKRSTRIRIKPDFKKDGIRETAAQARARAQQIADAYERADAGAVTAQKIHATINALLPGGGVPSVEEYIASYLQGRTASASTIRNARSAVKSFLSHLGADSALPLDAISTGHINAWMTAESRRIRTSTLSRYKDNIFAIFRTAYEAELIARNPVAAARVPRTVDPAPIVRRSFSLADLRKLVSLLSPDWAMAVRLCVLLGGLRLGDVCNLRWSQFDLERMECRLVTGKTGQAMFIPLLPALIQHLEAWPRRGAYILPEFHMRYNSSKRSSLSTDFTSFVRSIGMGRKTGEGGRSGSHGMTDLTFHMLRSTAATILREAGVDEAIAMRVLAHNSAAVHRVYIRPTDESIRRHMQHLDIDI